MAAQKFVTVAPRFGVKGVPGVINLHFFRVADEAEIIFCAARQMTVVFTVLQKNCGRRGIFDVMSRVEVSVFCHQVADSFLAVFFAKLDKNRLVGKHIGFVSQTARHQNKRLNALFNTRQNAARVGIIAMPDKAYARRINVFS